MRPKHWELFLRGLPFYARRTACRNIQSHCPRRAGRNDGPTAELEKIVRERVNSLWDLGITGADLVIACVGAGLRAFTAFSSVEDQNLVF